MKAVLNDWLTVEVDSLDFKGLMAEAIKIQRVGEFNVMQVEGMPYDMVMFDAKGAVAMKNGRSARMDPEQAQILKCLIETIAISDVKKAMKKAMDEKDGTKRTVYNVK